MPKVFLSPFLGNLLCRECPEPSRTSISSSYINISTGAKTSKVEIPLSLGPTLVIWFYYKVVMVLAVACYSQPWLGGP